jgi:hypothetical protein
MTSCNQPRALASPAFLKNKETADELALHFKGIVYSPHFTLCLLRKLCHTRSSSKCGSLKIKLLMQQQLCVKQVAHDNKVVLQTAWKEPKTN